jgi:NACalpha-BTF3-like transcription factor
MKLRVEVAWQIRDSGHHRLRTFQNDLGDEVALEEDISTSALAGHVLHHTGKQFVLLSERLGPRPRGGVVDSDVTAGKVKLLREQTGFRMMACKRALEATNGDLDAARKLLRGGGH